MKIYRIETITTLGAFRGNSRYEFATLLNISYDESRKVHPNPKHDSKLMDSLGEGNFYEYNFGFISIEQLKTWFFNDDVKLALDNEGMMVSVYDAEEFHIGNSQVMFIMDSAELLERISLLKI